MIEELLKKLNLKWDDLDTPGHSGEKDYLLKLAEQASESKLTLEGLKERVILMREGLEQELTQYKPNFFTWFFGWKKDFLLKARLRNCIIIENILTSPDRAKKQMEEMLGNIARR